MHKKTCVGFHALEIWDKFSDPYSEEWVFCPDPLCAKKVTPVKSHIRTMNGEEYTVVSFFRHQEGVGGCIYPEGDEHKRAKIIIATMVENQKVPLVIGKTEIPYSSLHFKNVPRLAFRWEQKREDRKADVLFEFEEWHPALGQGIVFEAQMSNITYEEMERRETDWVSKGYSLVWLRAEDFTENSLTHSKIKIDNVWVLKLAKIMEGFTKNISQTYSNLKKDMVAHEQKLTKTCRTCSFGSIDRINKELVACWINTRYRNGTHRRPNLREPLYSCTDWEAKEWNDIDQKTSTHS